MGPLGIHGGQPNPAFICFSQCNVQKKRSLNLRSVHEDEKNGWL